MLVIVLTLTLWVAWRISRVDTRAIQKKPGSVSQPIAPDTGPPTHGGQTSRRLCRISLAELLVLFVSTDDLLVIDLRPGQQRDSFPVLGDDILCVQPNELPDVLEWLPSNKNVVFCGASELCITMIQTSPCIYGSAPLYVLEDSYPRREVA